MFKTRRFEDSHIEDALAILHDLYQEEAPHHQSFLSFDQSKDSLKEQLTNLSKHSTYAYALYNDEEFIGIILGHVIPSLWGKYDGFYSPLYANAVRKEFRQKGYQFLYQHLSEELVANNILSHAITLYTNDETSMNTWFHLGFGLRLVDSIKEITQTTKVILPNNMKIHSVTEDNIDDFLVIQKKLHFYFEKAPLFMPQSEEDEKENIAEFISHEEHYMFGLYLDGSPIGLMKIRPTGENVLTTDKNSIHICGLYVNEDLRTKGYAKMLLDYVEYQCHLMGYTLIGVDFESFNLRGAAFWHKYFTPYTYTLTRRIDENILKRK